MNPFSLKDKIILVTGASSGIGKDAAIAIARAGAKLIISGRNESRLADTLEQLDGEGHRMIVVDYLSDEPEKVLCNHITQPLNGILHCAGLGLIRPLKFSGREYVQEIMKVNFEIPYAVTQLLHRQKKIAVGGSVLYISSLAGSVVSVAGNSIYGASKAAVNGAVKGTAVELAKSRIRVNSLLPGIVKTKMTEGTGYISADDYKNDEQQYPLGHGSTEDIANTVVYFLSDASKWVTGTNFIIDGGVSIK